MNKKSIIAGLLILQLLLLLFTGCGAGGDSGSSQSDTPANVSDDNNAEELDADDSSSEAAPANIKFVSKNYMLTTLTSKDCTISEDESGLNFYTDNSVINISITPGIQNLSSAATYMQASVPTYFPEGQASDISDGYLFGYRAKMIGFSCTMDDTPCEGLLVLSIINQSLYMMSILVNDQTTPEEFELMQATISNMVVLSPSAVDSTTHQASYYDPYADYTDYYAYEDYYDISSWYYLPYAYYAWCQLDYSAWSDMTLFEPDWDYYSDESLYWTWGWDETDDWVFYDEYYDYYEETYYEEQTDYYEDFNPDDYDVWYEESDFTDYVYEGE